MVRLVGEKLFMSTVSAKKTLLAGVSPCPNDTYIFAAWVLGMIGDLAGLRTRFLWEDVQTLNERACRGMGDLVKVSAVQALKLEGEYDILQCGGALSTGPGPKLVVVKNAGHPPFRIAVPGMQTTAYALLRACADFKFEPVPMAFDEIPGAVVDRQVDGGLLIHETALIHEKMGLEVFLDLGAWWMSGSSGLPLPLGLIVIKKDLPLEIKLQAEFKIRQSLDSAEKNPRAVQPLIKAFARELDDTVIDQHIRAYVNAYSFDIGEQGSRALSLLKNYV